MLYPASSFQTLGLFHIVQFVNIKSMNIITETNRARYQRIIVKQFYYSTQQPLDLFHTHATSIYSYILQK